MIPNSEERRGGMNGGVTLMERVPKLLTGSMYQQWSKQMTAWLNKQGLRNVHLSEYSVDIYNQMVAKADTWSKESELEHLVRAGINPAGISSSFSSSSSSSSSSSPPPSDSFSSMSSRQAASAAVAIKTKSEDDPLGSSGLVEEVLAAAKAKVDISKEKVVKLVASYQSSYYHIRSALPADIQQEVDAVIPTGYAPGIWKWIKNKYESNHGTDVVVMLNEFLGLSQGDRESFALYYAKVVNLLTKLSAAGHPQQALLKRMILLDKLRVEYDPLKTALSLDPRFSNDAAETMNWEAICEQMLNHEKTLAQLEGANAVRFNGRNINKRGGYAGAGTGRARGNMRRDESETKWPSEMGEDVDIEEGDHDNDSDTPGANSSARSRGPRCFKCHQFGHIKMNCPRLINSNRSNTRSTEGANALDQHLKGLIMHSDEEEYSGDGQASETEEVMHTTSSSRAGGRRVERLYTLGTRSVRWNTAGAQKERLNTVKSRIDTDSDSELITSESDLSSVEFELDWHGHRGGMRNQRNRVMNTTDTAPAAPASTSTTSEAAVPSRPIAGRLRRGDGTPVTQPAKESGSTDSAAAKRIIPKKGQGPVSILTNSKWKDTNKSFSKFGIKVGTSNTAGNQRSVSAPNSRSESPAAPSTSSRKGNVGGDLFEDDNHTWTLDSAASVNVCKDRDRLGSIRTIPAVDVMVANGEIIRVRHQGEMALILKTSEGKGTRQIIKNILYHPQFSANLLSWCRLRYDGFTLMSSKEKGDWLFTPGRNSKKVMVNVQHNVLKLRSHGGEYAFRTGHRNSQGTVNYNWKGAVVSAVSKGKGSLMQLHVKLAHMGVDRLIQLIRSKQLVGIPTFSEEEIKLGREEVLLCGSCAIMKSKSTAFGHRGLDTGSIPGEVVHMDTFFIVTMINGTKVLEYGVTMSDPNSGEKIFRHATKKDQIPVLVKGMMNQLECQGGSKLKRIYMDGGSEFINQTLKEEWYKKGVVYHNSPPGEPELNGIAERWGQTLKLMGTTMLHYSGVPSEFWQYAMEHATYIWNRSHVSKITGKTPYEYTMKEPASAQHWGVFGCSAFAHIEKSVRKSLEPKSELVLYLGHNTQRNCATVYSLLDSKIRYTRNVVYRINNFDCARAVSSGEEAISDLLEQLVLNQSKVDSYLHTNSEVDAEENKKPGEKVKSESVATDMRRLGSSSTSMNVPESEDSEGEYDVQDIIGRRRVKSKYQYLVRWKGYGDEENSWIPRSEARNLEALDRFEAVHGKTKTVLVPESEEKSEEDSEVPTEDSKVKDAQLEEEPANNDVVHEEKETTMMVMKVINDLVPEDYWVQRIGAESGKLPERNYLINKALAAVSKGITNGRNGVPQYHTPTSYKDAMKQPNARDWRVSMEKEVKACVDRIVWTEVLRSSLPAGTNVIKNMWVYRVKLKADGTLDKLKSRTCPRGDMQKEGEDYFQTFAHTALGKSLRITLHLIARFNMEIAQGDVPEAFLNAPLEEDVYMELPEGFTKPGVVVKLNKSLYGLKQAPRNWDKLIHPFITEDMGYKATVSDRSLYYKRSRGGRLMILYRFVDDIIGGFMLQDSSEFAEGITLLKERFQIKMVQKVEQILGMRITRDRAAGTIKLDLEQYINAALHKYGMDEVKATATPQTVQSNSVKIKGDGHCCGVEPADGGKGTKRQFGTDGKRLCPGELAYKRIAGTEREERNGEFCVNILCNCCPLPRDARRIATDDNTYRCSCLRGGHDNPQFSKFCVDCMLETNKEVGRKKTRNADGTETWGRVFGTRTLVEEPETDTGPVPVFTSTSSSSSSATQEKSELCDRQQYMEITGTVMYAATVLRIDIAHAAYSLACHMQAPTQANMVAAKRVLRYLSGTKTLGIIFGSADTRTTREKQGDGDRGFIKQTIDICAFADADWGNDKKDRKSITGWIAKLNGDPISWASKKQRTVALSTCEAELYAQSAAMQEVIWLRGILTELGLHVQTGSRILGDNQSTIAISKKGNVKGERTKHIDIRYKFVTEVVENGIIDLQWIPTTEQQADILTKALPAETFVKFRQLLIKE